MDMQYLLLAVLAGGVVALLYALVRARWIDRQPAGEEALRRISGYISQGAMTFLGREYRALVPFVIVAGGFLAAVNWGRLSFQGLSFAAGPSCSALAGFVGMRVATAANVRTTHAAQSGMPGALRVAFVGGSVMGMSVVGLGLVGVCAVILVTISILGARMSILLDVVTPLLTGFALGGSSIALFMRVGGGIYTKAADIGADLVGKLEAGIPEDDPRNPATIADNVGDNVGDVAGMGADLFESYVGALVGSMILGVAAAGSDLMRLRLAGLPLILCALGILASIAGTFLVRVRKDGSPQRALNTGTFGAAALAAVLAYPATVLMVGRDGGTGAPEVNQIFLAFITGLAAGALIGFITEYFTGTGQQPRQGHREGIRNRACHNHHHRRGSRDAVQHARWSWSWAPRSWEATRLQASTGWGLRPSGCLARWAYSSPWMRTAPLPTTPGASRRWRSWHPRCATSPTASTRWAIRPRQSARASRSDPPRWRPSACSPLSRSRPGRRSSTSRISAFLPGSSSALESRSSSLPWPSAQSAARHSP